MKYRNQTQFSINNVVIVCHDSVFGPPHELRDYLLKIIKVKTLLFIGHSSFSMPNNPVKSSYFELYENGIKIKKFKCKQILLPEYFAYIRDFILTVFWSIFENKLKIDYFIGLGNLNAFSGLVLKFLGKINRTIYYIIDYVPVRFKNNQINNFYHWLDKYCATSCDFTWNYSGQMIREREKHWGFSFGNQLIVPNGVNVSLNLHSNNSNNHDLVYIGSLFKRQGIELILNSLPKLINNYPDIKLKIIGQGPYKNQLKNLCKKLKIQDSVIFLGFIEDPKKADQIIQKCSLGMATYETSHNFVGYTEPGKVKRYLACGVPMVMTDVSEISKDLVKYKCGFVINYDTEQLVKVISDYFNNPKIEISYRKNAIRYVGQFTWDKIFSGVFKKMSKIIKN
jgi:glycosyltransferase involved in cell wall biosynthesis